MKVLLIAPAPPPVGGIESVTDNLVNYLKSNGNGTSMMLYNTSHRYRPVTSKSKLIRVVTGVIDAIKTYFDIGKLIKNKKPDIIHLASSASLSLFKDYLLIKRSYYYRIPIVVHWHFGRIPALKERNNWEWKLLKKVIKLSTMSIVIDNKSYETLMECGFSNIEYIPNPLAFDIEKMAKEINLELTTRQNSRLIYVGHVIKNKGVFELVKACSSIHDINELILIGPYEESIKKELIKLSDKKKTQNWLKFTGQIKIEDVANYMKDSPILLLPSYTEGFPMVILEAMALGCAIIATDVGAIPEMLNINSETPCGVCIAPKRVDYLKEAIEKLTQNEDDLKMYGRRANMRVLSNYTISNVFYQYKRVWQTAIELYSGKIKIES